MKCLILLKHSPSSFPSYELAGASGAVSSLRACKHTLHYYECSCKTSRCTAQSELECARTHDSLFQMAIFNYFQFHQNIPDCEHIEFFFKKSFRKRVNSKMTVPSCHTTTVTLTELSGSHSGWSPSLCACTCGGQTPCWAILATQHFEVKCTNSVPV